MNALVKYRLAADRFGPVGRFNNDWCIILDIGTPFEALFEPSFWREVAPRLKRRDLIRVFPSEGGYFAELIVWQAADRWAQVTLLRKVALDGPTEGTLEAGASASAAAEHIHPN